MSLGPTLPVPCRGAFAGIVQQVSPMQSTRSKGNDKLDFTLIDDDGSWIQCCAMGATADRDIIAE
eukprot:6627252-Karenia_brevis.AAC.1